MSGPYSAQTRARLRLAVVDLDTRTTVWDGSIFADTSSTFMKATALHEVEDSLVAHLLKEVAGPKR